MMKVIPKPAVFDTNELLVIDIYSFNGPCKNMTPPP